jgi:hypothetical protein
LPVGGSAQLARQQVALVALQAGPQKQQATLEVRAAIWWGIWVLAAVLVVTQVMAVQVQTEIASMQTETQVLVALVAAAVFLTV